MWTELMHKALDGDLSSQERETLELALRQDDVRREFEQLRRVQAALESMPPVSPPVAFARETARDIALQAALAAVATPPRSLASSLAARIAEEVHPEVRASLRALPRLVPPAPVAPLVAARITREARHNPAPLLLAGGLVAAFIALTASFAWDNLAAGATVLRELLAQFSPLVFAGFALLLVASAFVSWRPTPQVQRAGALAFALALGLTLPSLTGLFVGRSGTDVVRIGGDIVVDRPVAGNVIAIGGNVVLGPHARVDGEAVAFLGDVRQAGGAQVRGRASALLGDVRGGDVRRDLSTRPLPALGTASAFQPLLAWISGAAWPRIYMAALGALTLLLFLSGVAPRLARRQRHAPLRTLALGTLVFGLAVPPAVLGALSGFLVPAFVGGVLALLGLSTGLVVSLYDLGRTLLHRLRLPLADTLGALIGLSAFAATLSLPPLALALWIVGGCWGAGTLLLARPSLLQDT